MLHAESFKNANRAVIHFYWQSKGERTPRTAQQFAQSGFKIAAFRSRIELTLRDTKWV
jgi:hypothetical protein